MGIVHEYVHAKPFGDFHHMHTDMPPSDDADGLILKIEAAQSLEGEVPFPGALRALHYLSGECQDQGKGMLCHRILAIDGNIRHGNTAGLACCEVDVVITSGERGNEPELRELLKHPCRYRREDEHTDCLSVGIVRRNLWGEVVRAELDVKLRKPLRKVAVLPVL